MNDLMIGLLTGCRARAILCSVTLRTGAPKTSHSDSSTCSQCLAIQPVSDVHSESVKSKNLSYQHPTHCKFVVSESPCRIVPKEI